MKQSWLRETHYSLFERLQNAWNAFNQTIEIKVIDRDEGYIYTPSEEEIIRNGYRLGFPVKDIAKRLGRSHCAILAKAVRMRIKHVSRVR